MSTVLLARPAEPGAESSSGSPAAPAQHRRGPKQIMLENAQGAVIELWKPDLSRIPLSQEMGVITLPSTGMDNYHAIVVERDWGSLKESFIRYEYLRGKPSGQSPTKLTGTQKSAFEVMPYPIPRGHYHYFTNDQWSFVLRYRQRPIAHHPVTLETSNGSLLKGVTDAEGRVQFRLPDDFPNVIEGERDRRKGDFMVRASYMKEGVVYESALSAEYRINKSHWNSGGLGLLAGGIGLLAGGFFGRIKTEGKARS